ncbi:NAD(P)/FAD-dependent oxidoreductase [Pleurocapsa sp. PCC 7319]|uniref:NAD(P)/FAD-dependent oxidoreductase n=1 Tax=Pleurocapsa sp. PCC 7319 TaxID=118161 RepID=UPI000347388B|nr:NAD(P)/FAD-dependent oxidoreductase [Pleurocapsa sp. PCC 7319]
MNNNTKAQTSVVIVGGGIAGLLLASKAGRQLSRYEQVSVTLIDQSTVHIWKPMIPAFAAGSISSKYQQIPFLQHGAKNGFGFVPGPLVGVDRQAQTVRVGSIKDDEGRELVPERTVPYDYLVLALGSKAQDFGTPGVAEHCWFVDDLPSAEAFNNRIFNQIVRTASFGKPFHVAVVGGGSTGVELIAEIIEVAELASTYSEYDIRSLMETTLIEAGPEILKGVDQPVVDAVKKDLQQQGVKILVDSMVVEADADGLKLKNGDRIDTTIAVWSAGIAARDAVAEIEGLEKSRGGQIIVGPTLQSVDDERIFAIGDCSSYKPEGAERPLPPTAEVARKQALHLAAQLSRLRGNEDPLRTFKFKSAGRIVTLGQKNAYGSFTNGKILSKSVIRGSFARFTHELLYRRHQIELYGLLKAVAIWLSDLFGSVVRPPIRVS